ncbi:hypothetical protein GCM10010470_18490 [Saccharopolyspora taberi]|uniref:Uncharacterized protein n=1 Tax=Saccharopolyspora taberi TaxID=60895 RepID=A0ABN3VA00_9PSEU
MARRRAVRGRLVAYAVCLAFIWAAVWAVDTSWASLLLLAYVLTAAIGLSSWRLMRGREETPTDVPGETAQPEGDPHVRPGDHTGSSTGNLLSGPVQGPAVQAGTIHGPVVQPVTHHHYYRGTDEGPADREPRRLRDGSASAGRDRAEASR